MQNLGDTETDFHARAVKSSAKLLEALIRHHGQEQAKADYDTIVERLEEAVSKQPWFSIVEEVETAPKPLYPLIADIQTTVAKHYGVTRIDILSPRRTSQVVRPRQVAYYLARTLTLKTLPEIGRLFGGRDHTSVLHGVRKIESLKAIDAELAADVETLSARLTA